MRIFIDKNELDFKEINCTQTFDLNSTTSVNQQKAHFFDALNKIGQFVLVDRNKDSEFLKEVCEQHDVIFASMHEDKLKDLPFRLLQHTLGGLLLPYSFNCGFTFFRESTINIVTTQIQKGKIQIGLGNAAPRMGVFVPRLNEECFYLANHKNIKSKNSKEAFEIIYSGRIIANKGITQIVRALNIWPIENCKLTIIGKIEKNFHISQSNALHVTFEDFFKREVVGRNKLVNLNIQNALTQDGLREAFYKADCFVYPSFHEDENFGMAPREAMLCGIPFVVTDFCGLSELKSAKGGIVKTYPTLGGVRYSLKELRDELLKIKNWDEQDRIKNVFFNYEFVKEECNPDKSFRSLKNSVEELLKIPPSPAPENMWRDKKRIDKWALYGPKNIKQAIALAGQSPPVGLFVDGDGYASDDWYSEPHFFTAIQSLYTTFSKVPTSRVKNIYRGFWRIAIWNEEKAIVEFGFPGPRIKRYYENDWNLILNMIRFENNEITFYTSDKKAIPIIQELLYLGYLVPDKI
jgi:glycosyltransferase involved in cell wall biosynthesis